MKKSIVAAGVFALLASTGAKAADIVTYQEQAVAAPTQINWTGLYAGGTLGGSWATAKTRLKARNTAGVNSGKLVKKEVDPNMFIGGIFAGYNFQPGFLSGTTFLKDVVFGIETDFLFNTGDDTGRKGFNYAVDKGGDGKDYAYKAQVKQKWNGSTRLRAGYALGSEGRFLPYFAAGVSYADIQGRASTRPGSDTKGNQDWNRHSKTSTRAGWNVGVGVDYVPPIMNDHLILRAEYRYTDFGKDSYKWNNALGDASQLKQRVKFDQNDFRVGVAYKF